MSYPYTTISSNTDTLNTASFYTEKDLSVFYVSQSLDTSFGTSNKDNIEFSIFDIIGNQYYWNILNKKDTYIVNSATYNDVNNKKLTYNYKKFDSSYKISNDRKILLNTVQDLKDVGIQSGSNVISYNFLRNIAGSFKHKLVIKSISVERKELELVPNFKSIETDEESVLENLSYEGFAKKEFLVNDLVSDIVSELNTFNLYINYQNALTTNPKAVDTIRTIFGLHTDSDILIFIGKLYDGFYVNEERNQDGTVYAVNKKYDGIKNFITNWVYTYYKTLVTSAELQLKFKNIITTAADNNLKVLNYNYKQLDVTGEIVKFINLIFYDTFISTIVEKLCNKYTEKYFNHLKNALNFGNNKFIPMLTHTFYTDSTNKIVLVIKLFDYLPGDISIRDFCWISNISISPILQKVILEHPIQSRKFKISGPNFKVNTRVSNNSNTKQLNYTTHRNLNENVLQNKVDFNKKLKQIDADYSEFSNFIVFGSAQLRIKLFKNKLTQLTILNDTLTSIQSTIVSASSAIQSVVSSSFIYDVTKTNEEISGIYESFDGYDSYLFKNQAIVSGSNYQEYLDSAVEYDFNNRDSLVNNTPEYINANDENSEYLVFLSMAGHFFDNIYLYIKGFPIGQSNISSESSSSLLGSISNVLLESFGWKPISSTDNKSLNQYYLNNTENSSSLQLSYLDKMTSIWGRILNSLPVIYKTKGTEESIRLLSNVYGIPHNLLNIKEYGGNKLSSYDSSSYTFDKKYYFTKFTGSNEYITIPYKNDTKTVEFKFSINSTYQYSWNTVVNLMYKDSNFNAYLIKDRADVYGTLNFKLYDQTFSTESLPLFNGFVYNVIIRKDAPPTTLIDSSNVSLPSQYIVTINSVDDDRVIFSSTVEKILEHSYEGYFSSSASIYFGNYTQNNLYGKLDKINLWSTVLSDEHFLNHCKNFDAYDDGEIDSTYSNLYFRYSFDYPQNLASSSIYSIDNYNRFYKHGVYNTGSVTNFKNTGICLVSCSYASASVYPFQFEEVDIFQNISLDGFGPNQFKNSKINKVTQTALARLMPDHLSTSDINISNNSNLVGVYISPYEDRNNDIINFLGNYNLMNVIGDPANLYKNSYEELNNIRDDYNASNLGEKILFQEFITLFKNYFDSSFFDSVKKLVPARSTLLSGVVIEPNIIERSKYENKQIDSEMIKIIEFIPSVSLYSINSELVTVRNIGLSSGVPINRTPIYSAPNTTYISNDSMDLRLSAFSISGNYFSVNSRGDFVNNTIIKIKNNKYVHNFIANISQSSFVTGSSVTYTLTTTSSNFSPEYIDNDKYPVGHYSRNGNKYIFMTTSDNTVDNSGNLDGSSPINITSVNKNIPSNNLISI
jgi:hypothetical protein